MKRLIVFSFDQYYPGGGLGDCQYIGDKIAIFESLEEIKKFVPPYGWCDYIQVLDLDTLEIIAGEDDIKKPTIT